MESTNENEAPTASGLREILLLLPALFIYVFSAGMTGTVGTDMMLYRTCRSLLTTNKSSCDILHTNSSSKEASEIQKIVQPQASYIMLCDSLVNGIISAVLILFLGPWSDKYGRKPLLIIGTLAPIFHNVIISILNCWDVNPWMFMISSISSTLVGGGSGLNLAAMCFISDVTKAEKRSWQLGLLEAVIMAGLIVGTFIGPLIFQNFGYVVLFTITSLLSSIAFLHTMFWVPETIQKEVNGKWGNPFNVHLVKELFKASVKKRLGLNRWTLWNCIFVLSLLSMITNGQGKISYLFANARLGWNTEEYSHYNIASVILSVIGAIVGLKLMKAYLGCKDITQALVGCISGLLAAIIMSFTTKPWHMYLAISVGIFTSIISPTVQTILSTSAPSVDMGKIFSLITFLGGIVPLGGSPLYTLIYSNYMPPVYPSPVFLLSGGIFFLMMVPIILMNWGMINNPSSTYEEYTHET